MDLLNIDNLREALFGMSFSGLRLLSSRFFVTRFQLASYPETTTCKNTHVEGKTAKKNNSSVSLRLGLRSK